MTNNLSAKVLMALTFSLFSFWSPLQALEVKPFLSSAQKSSLFGFAPKYSSGEFFTESHVFYGKFPKGGSYWLKLITTNLGLGDGKLKYRLRITLPGGQKHYSYEELDQDQWKFEKPFKWTCGKNIMTSDNKSLRILSNNSKFKLHCDLKPIIAPWQPGDGEIFYGKKRSFYKTQLVPKASLNCSFIQGGKTQKVKGISWMVHTRTNIAPFKQALGWISYENFSENEFLFFRYLHLPKYAKFTNSKRRGLAYGFLTRGNKMAFSFFKSRYKFSKPEHDRESKNRFKSPRKVAFLAKSTASSLKIILKAAKLSKREAYLDTIPFYQRIVVSKFAKPIEYRYQAKGYWVLKNGKTKEKASFSHEYVVNSLN